MPLTRWAYRLKKVLIVAPCTYVVQRATINVERWYKSEKSPDKSVTLYSIDPMGLLCWPMLFAPRTRNSVIPPVASKSHGKAPVMGAVGSCTE